MPTPFTNRIHCATTAKLDALRDDLRSVRQREPHAHCIVFTEHSGAHAKTVAMLEQVRRGVHFISRVDGVGLTRTLSARDPRVPAGRRLGGDGSGRENVYHQAPPLH